MIHASLSQVQSSPVCRLKRRYTVHPILCGGYLHSKTRTSSPAVVPARINEPKGPACSRGVRRGHALAIGSDLRGGRRCHELLFVAVTCVGLLPRLAVPVHVPANAVAVVRNTSPCCDREPDGQGYTMPTTRSSIRMRAAPDWIAGCSVARSYVPTRLTDRGVVGQTRHVKWLVSCPPLLFLYSRLEIAHGLKFRSLSI